MLLLNGRIKTMLTDFNSNVSALIHVWLNGTFYVSVHTFNESTDAWIAFNRKKLCYQTNIFCNFSFSHHIVFANLLEILDTLQSFYRLFYSQLQSIFPFLLDSADCAKMVFIVFSRRHTLKYLYLTLDKSNF